MTFTRPEVDTLRQQSMTAVAQDSHAVVSDVETAPRTAGRTQNRSLPVDPSSPVRKAAIVLVSLDQSLASQLLSHLDRSAVEAVTWEIARLERVEPVERNAVLEEFYGLGLRRLSFVFEDLVKMNDSDIRAAFDQDDMETWALALAGTASNVRAKVLEALPSAAADRLSEHLDHLGPFRLSNSESAQLDITERMRRLYDHGKISLPEPNGQDEVLV
jgi:flagellar motor switch protein FliG